MKALVLGATGATGKDVLQLLLKDPYFSEVHAFTRRPIVLQHPKLHIHQIDFDDVTTWKNLVRGEVLFSCLGTTIKVAGSQKAQWKIDFDYQLQFAKIAKENGVSQLVLVSAEGASASSAIFYSRMKGQLEEELKKLQFQKLIIFRPPLLIRENTDRMMEVWGAKVLKVINRLGILISQKPLPTPVLASSMVETLKNLPDGIHTIPSKKIWGYARTEFDS